MRSTSQQLAFALRAPSSGPLAAVLCALADLFEDPNFNSAQREMLCEVLNQGDIPQSLADAASARLMSFANSLEDLHSQIHSDHNARGLFDFPSEELPRMRCVV